MPIKEKNKGNRLKSCQKMHKLINGLTFAID